MFDAIAEVADPKAKAEQYKVALDQALASGDVQRCQQFIDHGEARAVAAGGARRRRQHLIASTLCPLQCSPMQCPSS